jgi:hypothetical protein
MLYAYIIPSLCSLGLPSGHLTGSNLEKWSTGSLKELLKHNLLYVCALWGLLIGHLPGNSLVKWSMGSLKELLKHNLLYLCALWGSSWACLRQQPGNMLKRQVQRASKVLFRLLCDIFTCLFLRLLSRLA